MAHALDHMSRMFLICHAQASKLDVWYNIEDRQNTNHLRGMTLELSPWAETRRISLRKVQVQQKDNSLCFPLKLALK